MASLFSYGECVCGLLLILKQYYEQTSETRWKVGNRRFNTTQGSNKSKDRKIELINKGV